MNKIDRLKSYEQIMQLMLSNQNKQAFEKLRLMCGKDTGLLSYADYNKEIKRFK